VATTSRITFPTRNLLTAGYSSIVSLTEAAYGCLLRRLEELKAIQLLKATEG